MIHGFKKKAISLFLSLPVLIILEFFIILTVLYQYLFVTVSILWTQKIGQRYQEELHDYLQATRRLLGEVDM